MRIEVVRRSIASKSQLTSRKRCAIDRVAGDQVSVGHPVFDEPQNRTFEVGPVVRRQLVGMIFGIELQRLFIGLISQLA